MQSDGTIVDGDAFLKRAMVKLDGLAGVLTSIERRSIEKAMVRKMWRPTQQRRSLLDRHADV
jgi:hypothetical protein